MPAPTPPRPLPRPLLVHLPPQADPTVTPYYADDRATLYRGDALAVLRDLPDATVDALITDPPYSSGGQFRGDRVQDTATKYLGFTTPDGRPNGGSYEGFTGDNRDQRAFAYWTALWLGEALRLARPGALVMIFTDWRQLPTVTDAIQAGGWVYRGIVAWDKHNVSRPRPVFRAGVEFCVWGSHGGISDYPPAAVSSVLACAPPRERDHMTQKPIALMRSLVAVTRPNATVIDPFMGAGSTGVATLAEGRRFVGVELTEHFSEVAERRIRTASGQPITTDGQAAIDFGEWSA